MELIGLHGFRQDGRHCDELRKINCKLGVLPQADGSAVFEVGNTKVMAAVYGPHEPSSVLRHKVPHDRALLNCVFSMATFSTTERKKRPTGDKRSQSFSINLKQAFDSVVLTHLYPRSQIDLYVQVTQSDGANYAACINAATLAFIDACIPMKDYVSACTASIVDEKGVLDVSYLEESQGCPVLTLALLPRSEEIVVTDMNARLHLDHLPNMLDFAMKGCKDIFSVMESATRAHVNSKS
ncbi:exosome complex component RRP41-like [Symsagittifera roscoffensis]|uniref:exosome complex component RRP41-like n=1 Tax=Symsagittifera roscoffensis TaxID=84072 RepID=UPI00307B9931